MLNAGAGILLFDADDPDSDSESYFAINAGAKLYYNVHERVSLVVSPQGDIAFSKEEEVGTNNSWVWPITAGIALRI